MIDPLETVIQYVKAAGLSTTQIASKDRYGEAWEVGSKSLVINLDGGQPDIYLPVQNVRLEVRAYGSSRLQALQLLGEFVDLSRETQREPVAVTGGVGLLYFINQASGPSGLYDESLGMDFILQFYDAKVCEVGV